MATRKELVDALNLQAPSSLEVCVKVGEAYYTVNVADITVPKLFKLSNGRLSKEGKADDTLTNFVCIVGAAP